MLEHAREAQRQLHLRLAHAVAGEVALTAFGVAQRGGDRRLVELDHRLAARADLDERGERVRGKRPRNFVRLRLSARAGFAGTCQQREPGRVGCVVRERATRGGVARLAPLRAEGDARHHPQRVGRVVERAVALLGSEHRTREGFEAQIRRIGIRDGEQVLGVEVDGAREFAANPAAEKVALEIRVVRDDGAAAQLFAQALAHRVERRRARDHRVADASESLDRRRDRGFGRDQRRYGASLRCVRIEQQRSEFEDARARVVREPRRLEIDDRDRPDARKPRRQRRDVDGRCIDHERAFRRRCRPCTPCPGES